MLRSDSRAPNRAPASVAATAARPSSYITTLLREVSAERAPGAPSDERSATSEEMAPDWMAAARAPGCVRVMSLMSQN